MKYEGKNPITMKNIKILLFGIILLFVSCHHKEKNMVPDYDYQWKLKVTYTNGDIDTVQCGRNSFNGNPVDVYIMTTEPLSITSGGVNSCLTMKCGLYYTRLSCGVRKFEILSFDKTLLKQ